MNKNKNMQSQYWVFTVNNYSDADFQRVLDLDKACVFYVFGKEIAPTTGTQHLQGYIEFKERKRFGAVKRLFPIQTHLEIARGSWLQNVCYCTKEGDYYCSDKDIKLTVDVIRMNQDLISDYTFVEQFNLCNGIATDSSDCDVPPRQIIEEGIRKIKFGIDYNRSKRRYIESVDDSDDEDGLFSNDKE